MVDNPRLTVRLAPGTHPQPVVLDSLLRIPDDCALLSAPVRPLWLICDEDAPEGRQRALEARGAQVLRLPLHGPYPARWPAVLAALATRGVGTLMVEGGAAVITSLLQSGLPCKLALTVVLKYLAGLPGVQPGAAPLPALLRVRQQQLGDDLLIEADLNHD